MTTPTKEELLASLLAITEVDHQRPTDITLRDWVAACGLNKAAAEARLQHLVEEGFLTRHRVVLNSGRQGLVWRATDKVAE